MFTFCLVSNIFCKESRLVFGSGQKESPRESNVGGDGVEKTVSKSNECTSYQELNSLFICIENIYI
jgi:hypothetical protein